MDMEYAGACNSNVAPEDKGIHIGAVVLIMYVRRACHLFEDRFSLFSVALVYFIGGAIFNRLVKHRSGINLVPHAQFWIGLPLLAIVR